MDRLALVPWKYCMKRKMCDFKKSVVSTIFCVTTCVIGPQICAVTMSEVNWQNIGVIFRRERFPWQWDPPHTEKVNKRMTVACERVHHYAEVLHYSVCFGLGEKSLPPEPFWHLQKITCSLQAVADCWRTYQINICISYHICFTCIFYRLGVSKIVVG